MALGCGASPPAGNIKSPPPASPPATRPLNLELVRPAGHGDAKSSALLDEMTQELARSMTALRAHADPPYFASYEVVDGQHVSLTASFGTLEHSTDVRRRALDVDVRVGEHKLDNTHQVHGPRSISDFRSRFTVSASLPIEDDGYAIRSVLWKKTDEAYKRAAEDLQRVQATASVTTEAEDKADDFSRETATVYHEAPAALEIDRAAWESRLRALSAEFRRWPDLTIGQVGLIASAETIYYVNSDGTSTQQPRVNLRVTIQAETVAADGMELRRFESFEARSPDRLPDDAAIRAKVQRVADDLVALRKAPVAEPYLGPAILEGKAASVFFHEVFGHRIEGHRQKTETEGQTFAKKIGQPIMPAFLNVYDDPTIATLDRRDLNGFYRFDDEGIAARKASLVENGVLKTFLLSRAPTRGFTQSNGHGRRSEHFSVVARQGNLVVEPTATVGRAELTKQLLELVKQQGKPYGLVFRELDGGFTMTQRFEPQSFKLLSVMVSKLYPDGHEELIRGADLEGTPLRALADIVAAADDVDVFNGYCGAESGFVPVSSTSPSLLIAHVEVAKKPKDSDKPPLLPAPTGGGR
jgi:predicted Zn-dependent protease